MLQNRSLPEASNEAYRLGNAVLSPVASPAFSLAASVKDGVVYEGSAECGWGHFLEHMNMQRTAVHKSLMELTMSVESMGGRIEAYTERDDVVFHVTAPSWGLKRAFDTMRAIFSFSSFDDATAESERAIIRQEALRERASQRSHLTLRAESDLLEPSPAARYSLGTEESLAGATGERLSEYKRRVYCRENSFLTLCGGFDAAEAEDLCGEFYESLPKGEKRSAEISLSLGTGLKRRSYPCQSPPEQIQVVFGFGLDGEAGVTEAMLFNTLTGAGFSSLFYRRLRHELKLTYTTATFLRRYPGAGTFRLVFALNPRDMDRAEEAVFSTLDSIARGEISDEDMESAGNRLWGSTVMRLSNVHDYGAFMNRGLISLGKPRLIADFRREIEALGRDDMAKFAEKYMRRDNCSITRIGQSPQQP